jgi:hypothetical protein
MKKTTIIIKIIIISSLFPVAMLLLGLVFEVIYPGFFHYLSNLCHGLNDCLTRPAFEYLLREKTQHFFLFSWGIGLAMVSLMAYQNLRTEIHEWIRKFK